MAPKPQENTESKPLVSDAQRVVISGMSGLFPKSHNVKDLSNILYNKIDPISNEDMPYNFDHPEVSQYCGTIPDKALFDAQFFKVHYWLANCMDTMSRKILEQSYQAIYDAGLSPQSFSGKKVGVFIGSSFSESESSAFYTTNKKSGLGITGCNKAMFANRISYWLNARGPSMSIDNACCSSIAALEQGYLAISRGECEAAIVGGANLCLHPHSSVHFSRIIKQSTDGKTKSFDQDADGCIKTEAINVLFLQKAKDALRVYADVMHVKCEFTSIMTDGIKPRYGFYRDPDSVRTFLTNFYNEAKVRPQEVQYVEAFGSAVPEADKAELEAIGKVFCENRENPLLVGSVMSNIGYGEAASGISGVTKVLLGYQKGKIAANLNCTTPRNDVPAIRDGAMKIVTEHESFKQTYTAVNSMSLTGVNAHVLLHGRYKEKDLTCYKTKIPQLVTISARQESGVKRILTELKTRPVDPEELALFRNIHKTNILGHMGRGYILLDTDIKNGQLKVVSEKVDYFDETRRPLWFVYSGMGSQWTMMGKELMQISVFAAAIQKCHRVLEPKGLDIVSILTSSDKTTFDNILHSFVGIAAVQIGLTDVLREIGIVPDKIIGHSVGELGCAYADGCFTAEEMILSAYSRGLISVQTKFIKGSMAAVGLGYQQIIQLCPPEIEVACHNAAESSTISGPAEIMTHFVDELKAKGIFAKEVPCSNIAYHSRYIADAGPGLLNHLREVIKSPKKRSERWLSTSVPQERWTEQQAQYSSPEYHTNNLLNPVLFEETMALVPPNAVLVEIAPHGLLQAILKRSLPISCKNIALTRRGHPDNSHMLLDGIGKLYMEGFNADIAALYPKVQFPVSSGTPMLNNLIEWVHLDQWSLPLYVSASRRVAASRIFVISLHDDEYKYIRGYITRGVNKYPFSACLVACWDTLAMTLGVQKKQLSVQFKDLKFYAQPTMHDRRQLRLSVNLHRGTGRFEILDEDSKVATGYIIGEVLDLTLEFDKKFLNDDDMVLDQNVVYQLLQEKDYGYEDEFRSIYNSNASFTNAQIIWNNNWATFIDGMLQLNALRQSHDGISEPLFIRRMCIDVDKHAEMLLTIGDKTVAVANAFEMHDFIRCGGVVIENIKSTNVPAALHVEEVFIKHLKFFPRFLSGNIDISTSLRIHLHLVSENICKDEMYIVGMPTLGLHSDVNSVLSKLVKEMPEIRVNYKHLEKLLDQTDHFLAEADLIVVQNLRFDDNLCQHLYRVLRPNTFILNVENKYNETVPDRPSGLYRIVSCYETKQTNLELLKWRPTVSFTAATSITVKRQTDMDFLKSTRNDIPANQKLIIFSSYPMPSGLRELVKKWRREAEKNQVYLFSFHDKDADNVSNQLPELDLAFNIFTEGTWGSEYFVPCRKNLHGESKMKLQSSRVNDLESLNWIEVPEIKSSGIPVQVHFAGLNDLDAKRATGLLSFKNKGELCQTQYGMDFSGVTKSGERVMGIVPGGAASNKVQAIPELLWPVPGHWSLEEAVTVPLPYAQAFYILAIKSSLYRGMKILIHGGTGALGQALISIALAHGCDVFTTVSSLKKKTFLKRLFPDLKDQQIGNSRDSSFGDMVMNSTKGDGVTVVVSGQKGELKNESFSCVGSFGVFIDTNQLQMQEDYDLGMSFLDIERNYFTVDFSSIIDNQCIDEILKIRLFMADGIKKGYVRPLSRIIYNASEVSRAFRLLSGARHRGRVVVRVGGDVLNVPRLVCSAQSMQVVIGDDKPLSKQFCNRLVSRGAKHLVVCVKTPSTYLNYNIRQWKNQGINVLLNTETMNSEQKITSFLQKTSQLAPIEGVYIITEDADKNDILKIWDKVTQKMAGIKHFVVVGSGNIIGEQICLQRASNNLPASAIELPNIKQSPEKIDATPDGSISWRKALDSIERGVKSDETVVTVVPKLGFKKTFLEEILEKANITLPSSVKATSTLQELGLEEYKIPSIATFLRNEHNFAFTDELIQNLTVQKLKELNEITSAAAYEPMEGLGNFFNYVDPDELLATTEMVFLSTLTSSNNSTLFEFDVNQTYLCLVPGMDGHHARFKTICERLKLPALVLQPGLDQFEESPRDMALRFAEVLLKKAEIKRQQKFYLLGYESGVVVALELAGILEDHGLTGTVFCVGASPKELKLLVEKQVKTYASDDLLKEEILRHMFKLMGGGITAELDVALEKTSLWEEKLDTCIGTLLGSVAHSAQYAKMLIEAAYARLRMLAKYEVTPRKLKSKIVMLQAATEEPLPSTLQEHSELPLSVYMLKAPLPQAALDLKCTAVINRHLDTELLEAFEKKNLCEAYFLNADTFGTENLGVN